MRSRLILRDTLMQCLITYRNIKLDEQLINLEAIGAAHDNVKEYED